MIGARKQRQNRHFNWSIKNLGNFNKTQ